MRKKQNVIETINEQTMLASLDGLLKDYIASKQDSKAIINELATAFVALYGWNNIGACKKIIKTLTTERNAFCRYLEKQGLLVKWNVKTDELKVWKDESFNGTLAETFTDFLQNESKTKRENRKAELENDLTIFKTEYEKKVKNLFKDLNEKQKAILKNILQNIN